MRTDQFGVTSPKQKPNKVIINTDSELYKSLKDLSKGEKKVLELVIKLMEYQTNLITFNGDTLLQLTTELTMADKTIFNNVSKLNKRGYISKTILPYEYVVNPTYSYTGSVITTEQYYKQFEEELK